MQVRDIIKIAAFINEKTNELIPHSSNLDNQGRYIDSPLPHRNLQIMASRMTKKADALGLLPKIHAMNIDLTKDMHRDELEDIRYKNQDDVFSTYHSVKKYLETHNIYAGRMQKFLQQDNLLRLFEECAANAIKWRIGNCMEKAFLALILLREYVKQDTLPDITVPISVEVFYIPHRADDPQDRSHTFLVLNRRVNSTNPLDWPDDTLIVDPWENKTYTIGEAKAGNSPAFTWVDIKKYWEDLCQFEYPSYIGPAFNHNQPHSNEWMTRATSTTKWWKSATLLFAKRPVNDAQPEAIQPVLDVRQK